MTFTPVDMDSWERRSHYEYYTNLLKCGYSVTVSLDITKLHRQVKEKGLRFYPVFVYCVSRQIAATKEFRMGRDKDGNPGYYDVLHPNYTIFHEDDHTFSDVWTAYTESGTPMLFPIITCGKFTERDGRLTMPFCVNIAHAAADGYHTSMFINGLQKRLDTITLKEL